MILVPYSRFLLLLFSSKALSPVIGVIQVSAKLSEVWGENGFFNDRVPAECS